jgi:hypothetical protein
MGRKATGLTERQPGCLERGGPAFFCFETGYETIPAQINLTAVERKQQLSLPNIIHRVKKKEETAQQ